MWCLSHWTILVQYLLFETIAMFLLWPPGKPLSSGTFVTELFCRQTCYPKLQRTRQYTDLIRAPAQHPQRPLSILPRRLPRRLYLARCELSPHLINAFYPSFHSIYRPFSRSRRRCVPTNLYGFRFLFPSDCSYCPSLSWIFLCLLGSDGPAVSGTRLIGQLAP